MSEEWRRKIGFANSIALKGRVMSPEHKKHMLQSRLKNGIERNWQRIQKTESCWNWTGTINPDGYGIVYTNSTAILAHRYFYEQLVGKIPVGLVIDHLCRNRRCVRPNHLEPVTNLVNIRRGALVKLTTHCTKGHELTDDNILIEWHRKRTQRVRRCRVCKSDQNRIYRQKIKSTVYGGEGTYM